MKMICLFPVENPHALIDGNNFWCKRCDHRKPHEKDKGDMYPCNYGKDLGSTDGSCICVPLPLEYIMKEIIEDENDM